MVRGATSFTKRGWELPDVVAQNLQWQKNYMYSSTYQDYFVKINWYRKKLCNVFRSKVSFMKFEIKFKICNLKKSLCSENIYFWWRDRRFWTLLTVSLLWTLFTIGLQERRMLSLPKSTLSETIQTTGKQYWYNAFLNIHDGYRL